MRMVNIEVTRSHADIESSSQLTRAYSTVSVTTVLHPGNPRTLRTRLKLTSPLVIVWLFVPGSYQLRGAALDGVWQLLAIGSIGEVQNNHACTDVWT